VEAGEFTPPEYKAIWKPEAGCVITDMFVVWSPDVRDRDIRAFLLNEGEGFLAPAPNYRIYYGSSTAPLVNLFQARDYRKGTEHPLRVPFQMPAPLLASDSFEVALQGTPIQVEARFGCEILFITRPFNS
jgi:hypothetical protein